MDFEVYKTLLRKTYMDEVLLESVNNHMLVAGTTDLKLKSHVSNLTITVETDV